MRLLLWHTYYYQEPNALHRLCLLSQKYNVETRAGCACAGPYGHDLMNMDDGRNFLEEGKPGFVRVSINYTHEKDDIDYLISAIKAVIKLREKVKMTGGKHLC